MKWRLAIFDWDGTLFDSLASAYGAIIAIFQEFSPGIKPPTINQYRNEITSNFTEFYYSHGIDREIINGAMMNEVRSRYMKGLSVYGKINEGAPELLRTCEKFGMRTAIVSASPEPEEVVKKILDDNDCRIDHVRLHAWPKDEALLTTASFFKVRPDDAFYCNDTSDGIAIAKQFGFGTIGITSGYNSSERVASAKPDFLAENLAAVARILTSHHP